MTVTLLERDLRGSAGNGSVGLELGSWLLKLNLRRESQFQIQLKTLEYNSCVCVKIRRKCQCAARVTCKYNDKNVQP